MKKVRHFQEESFSILMLSTMLLLTSCEKPTLTLSSSVKLREIQVSCEQSTAPKGVYVPCEAIGVYSDGTVRNVTYEADWGSSDGNVFESNTKTSQVGWVRGVAAGTGNVVAAIGNIKGTFRVNVTGAVPVSISVTPANQVFPAGAQQQYASTCVFSDNTYYDVTSSSVWNSQDTNVATVDSGGATPALVKAKALGTTSIEASFQGLTGSTSITVMNKMLVSIDVSPSTSNVVLGLSAAYTVTGTYSDASTVDLTGVATWSTLDGTIATVSNSPGNRGRVTGVMQGTTQVVASYAGFDSSGDVVVVNPTLNTITLSPSNPSIVKGLSQQLTATGNYSDGSSVDISEDGVWTTSNTNIAVVSNVPQQKGKVIAQGVGTATITVTVAGVTNQTTVTITPATLVSVSVSPTTLSIPLGTSQTLTATGTYTDGSTVNLNSSVVWNSSNTSLATVNNGVVSTVALGPVTISGSYGGHNFQSSVTVSSPILTSIAVTASGSSLAKGLTQQYTATGTYSDGTTSNLTSSATWSSSNTSVVTVNSSGLATGVGLGNANVVATVNTITNQAAVQITAPVLSSIAVTSSGTSLAKGLTQQYTATGTYSDGTTSNLTSSATWSSSNTSVVTVNSSGQATGVGLGNANITASLNSVTQQVSIQITAAVVASISVTASGSSIAKGLTQQYTATGTYSDGTTANLTSLVTWSSTNTAVAAVSNGGGTKGLATGTGVGTAQVKAELNSVSGQSSLQVTAAVLVSIAVTPGNSTIVILLEVKQMTATGTYSDGTTANITNNVVWTSSNTVTATISNVNGCRGEASGLGLGSTTITATAPGGIFGTTQLNGIL